MPSEYSIHNSFLSALCKEAVPVSVYLVNGIKLHGKLQAFDSTALLLKNTTTQLVYQHAISTIVPARHVILEGIKPQPREKTISKKAPPATSA